MLVSASVPITAGFDETVSSCQTNAGKVSNKGVELGFYILITLLEGILTGILV